MCATPTCTGSCLDLRPPWTVTRVELDVKGQPVEVFAEHTKPKT